MAETTKRVRVVNPGRRKRMSLLQRLHFGTARVRAAAKRMLGRKRNAGPYSYRKTKKSIKKVLGDVSRSVRKRRYSKATYRRAMTSPSFRRPKRRNVGSIVTVFPYGNPGRRRMATKRRRSRRRRNVHYGGRISTGVYRYTSSKSGRTRKGKVATRRRRRARRRNAGYRRIHSRAMTFFRPRRRRRRNRGYVSHRRRRGGYRRRNLSAGGFMTGTAGSVVGVLAGLALTRTLSGFLPATFATGLLGYVGIGAVAVIQGKVAGKVLRQPQFGHYMMVGGLAYLINKIINDFMPSLGGYTGVSGMGLIGGSSFYVPQVNQAGNMGSFMVPGAVMGALPSPTASGPKVGVGVLRRTGRLM